MKKSSITASIPSVFCWTKMGAEAGQGLEEIIRRKELERSAGKGLFCWGIGSSLGDAPLSAQNHVGGEIDVLFTKMKSPAKEIDSAPAAKAVWLSFIDASGKETDLPEHMLLTSRAISPSGVFKRHHYALICRSDAALSFENESVFIDSSLARNFGSSNALGSSQVTSVVRYEEKFRLGEERPYGVTFSAKLVRNGFVKLVNPVILEGELEKEYLKACKANSGEEWAKHLSKLKKLAKRELVALQHDHPNMQLAFG